MAEQPDPTEKPQAGADITQKTNYQSNSKKQRPGQPSEKVEVEKVVTGEVVIQKKTFGRKAKEAVVAADFRNVGGYLIWDVLIPAVKNVIVDTATKGIERAIYGDRAIRARDTSSRGRVQYPYHAHSDPINRRDRDRDRGVIDARSRELSRGSGRSDNEPYILSSRDDAERVLDEMTEIIDRHDYVTVATLKELIGFPSSPVDWAWGWDSLVGVKARQVREGYLIDFPSPKAIRQ